MGDDTRELVSATAIVALTGALPHLLFSTAIAQPPYSVATLLAVLATAALVMMHPNIVRQTFSSNAPCAAVAVAFIASTLAMNLGSTPAALMLAAALNSACDVFVFVAEADVLLRLGKGRFPAAAFGGTVLSFCIAALVFALPDAVAVALQPVMAVLLCTLLRRQRMDAAAAPPPPSHGRLPVPLSLLFVVAAYTVGMHYVRQSVGTECDWAATFAFATLFSCGLLALEFGLLPARQLSVFDIATALLISVPVLFVGAGFSASAVLVSAASIGYYLFSPRTYQLTLAHAAENGEDPLPGIALTYIVLYAMQAPAGCIVDVPGWLPGSGIVSFAVALVIAVACILCAFLLHENRARNQAFEFVRADEMGSVREDAEPDDPGNAFDEACAAIAARHSLTAKEGEVLALLARGRTSPSIAESMVVSLSTVKSHVLHIYQKLGIHSRNELAALVEHAVNNGE